MEVRQCDQQVRQQLPLKHGRAWHGHEREPPSRHALVRLACVRRRQQLCGMLNACMVFILYTATKVGDGGMD